MKLDKIKCLYAKRLRLSKETVAHLDAAVLNGVKGGTISMGMMTCIPQTYVGPTCGEPNSQCTYRLCPDLKTENG